MTREALDEEIELPLGELDVADETFCFRMSVYVNDLMGDLAKNGQDFPVVVRPRGPSGEGSYQLVCGFRRVTAARRLGWATVRAVVRELDDGAAYRLAYAENERRRAYSVVDRAHAVAKARQAGVKYARIGEYFGLKPTMMKELMSLARAPEQVQARVEAGDITPKMAVAMNVLKRRYPDFEYDRWLRTVLAEGLSVSQMKRRVSLAYDEPRRELVEAGSGGKIRVRSRVLVPAKMTSEERAVVRAELMVLLDALDKAEGAEDGEGEG